MAAFDQHHPPGVLQEDVAGFDVPVQQALAMQESQARQHPLREGHHVGRW